MGEADMRVQWDTAAPGWARWEPTIAAWTEPATETMLDMAGVGAGNRVLDLASGAGSQTLRAAERVGPGGRVVANDISATMLRHVRDNARAAGLDNVETWTGPAEELDAPAASFDAVVCRFGLMLFADPEAALAAARRALRPGGRLAAVVFTTPAANPFMAKTMQVLLRHAGKSPPAPGRPGIFALGAPGAVEAALRGAGFEGVERRAVRIALRLPSAGVALQMMQEAFGAYRAVANELPEAARADAWSEVKETLDTFDDGGGFVADGEVAAAAGAAPIARG